MWAMFCDVNRWNFKMSCQLQPLISIFSTVLGQERVLRHFLIELFNCEMCGFRYPEKKNWYLFKGRWVFLGKGSLSHNWGGLMLMLSISIFHTLKTWVKNQRNGGVRLPAQEQMLTSAWGAYKGLMGGCWKVCQDGEKLKKSKLSFLLLFTLFSHTQYFWKSLVLQTFLSKMLDKAWALPQASCREGWGRPVQSNFCKQNDAK